MQTSETKVPLKIERKFLISKLPEDIESYPHKEISQGYFSTGAGGSESVVRLRKKGKKYYLTVKSQSECDKFTPPSWFGHEVTDDSRYGNSSLAVNGLPDTSII
jgi:CYTH domain-containing protein